MQAHQDDWKSYQQLPRPTQLNCCMDRDAKQVLWGLEGTELPPQCVFSLEPVAVFVGKKKLTSRLEETLRFWCNRKFAKEVLADPKVMVLQPDEFEEVEWQSVYKALMEAPRMFQIWACKQTTGCAGTNKMLARYTPNHNKNCPSCGVRVETCGHVLACEEESRVDLLHKLVELLNQWMQEQGTDTTLRKLLVEYVRGRGRKLMCEVVGWRGSEWRALATSMDKIGWRRFMEGMILKEVLRIQGKAEEERNFKLSLQNWGSGLVMKLMEVTHGHWLYWNIHLHDAVSGEKAMNRKESLWKEVKSQLKLGEEGLAEEDQYLLEINLDNLDHSTGEEQLSG